MVVTLRQLPFLSGVIAPHEVARPSSLLTIGHQRLTAPHVDGMRMNVHSHQLIVCPMNAAPPALSERHVRILDAAERIFARSGIHTATINDVALEAGMSAGNLYRYFPSKEAIVAGLAERDRMAIAADFARLSEEPATLESLEALGRRHLVDEPREKPMMTLQIWAEASRNPAVAVLCRSVEGAVGYGLQSFIQRAKAEGSVPADLDDGKFISGAFMLVDGYMRSRATMADYDAEAGAELLFRCLRILSQTLLTEPMSGLAVAAGDARSHLETK